MAVGESPNVVMLMESLRLDLKRITRANTGFYTEVEEVDWPDFDPEDTTNCLAGDGNRIHLWLWTSPQTSGRESSADLRPTLEVLLMGVVKSARELQVECAKLLTDVRNVIYSNVTRDWPDGSVANVWGIMSRQTPGVAPAFRHHPADSLHAKSFISRWQFDYKNPFPNG